MFLLTNMDKYAILPLAPFKTELPQQERTGINTTPRREGVVRPTGAFREPCWWHAHGEASRVRCSPRE